MPEVVPFEPEVWSATHVESSGWGREVATLGGSLAGAVLLAFAFFSWGAIPTKPPDPLLLAVSREVGRTAVPCGDVDSVERPRPPTEATSRCVESCLRGGEPFYFVRVIYSAKIANVPYGSILPPDVASGRWAPIRRVAYAWDGGERLISVSSDGRGLQTSRIDHARGLIHTVLTRKGASPIGSIESFLPYPPEKTNPWPAHRYPPV